MGFPLKLGDARSSERDLKRPTARGLFRIGPIFSPPYRNSRLRKKGRNEIAADKGIAAGKDLFLGTLD